MRAKPSHAMSSRAESSEAKRSQAKANQAKQSHVYQRSGPMGPWSKRQAQARPIKPRAPTIWSLEPQRVATLSNVSTEWPSFVYSGNKKLAATIALRRSPSGCACGTVEPSDGASQMRNGPPDGSSQQRPGNASSRTGSRTSSSAQMLAALHSCQLQQAAPRSNGQQANVEGWILAPCAPPPTAVPTGRPRRSPLDSPRRRCPWAPPRRGPWTPPARRGRPSRLGSRPTAAATASHRRRCTGYEGRARDSCGPRCERREGCEDRLPPSQWVCWFIDAWHVRTLARS